MPRLASINPWWAVPLVAALSTTLMAVQQARVPSRADWLAAADVVRAGLQSGDGVTWAPTHADEARVTLHGLPAFRVPDVAAADLSRYDRVWLMGAFGRDFDDLPAGHRLVRRQAFGEVTLDLVEVGGERIYADLRADLERVRVSQVRGEQRVACDFWDGIGWHCMTRQTPDAARACLATPLSRQLARDPRPGRRLVEPNPWARFCGLDAWINVSRDVRVIGDEPRRCVWYHPRAGHAVRLEWPVDAARGERLVIDHGFTDAVTVARNTPSKVHPARLVARRGEVTLGEVEIAASAGWHRWEVPLIGEGPVVLELTTADHTDAHLCIDATVRGPR